MNPDKIKLKARQERFLRDPLPVRLGNLASNLARLKSFTAHITMSDAAQKIVYESKHFIEWTIGEAELALQVELIELQRQLAHWQLGWAENWNHPERRNQIAEAADVWTQKILARSGLLTSQNASV